MSRRTSPPFRADHVGSLLRPPAAAAGPRGLRRRADRGGRPARGRGRGDPRRGPDAGGGRPAVGHRRRVPPGLLAHGLHLPARRGIQGAGQPGGEVPQRRRATSSAPRPRCTSTARSGMDQTDLRRRLHVPAVAGDHRRTQADDPVAEHGALPRRPGHRSTRRCTRTWRSSGPTWPRPTPTRSQRLNELGCTYLQFDDTVAGLPERPGAAGRDRRTGRGRRAHAPALHQADQRRASRASPRTWPSPRTCAAATSAPPGRPRAATTSWPRRCSPSWPWTGSSWSTTTSGPAGSSRCGSCRQGKMVVLGLVTTKRRELESKDDLKRRIDEAAKYVPLDQLCLSGAVRLLLHGGGQRADLRRAGGQAPPDRRDRPRRLGRLSRGADIRWLLVRPRSHNDALGYAPRRAVRRGRAEGAATVRITAGWSLRHHPDQAARAEPGSEADELTAELTASYRRAHDQRLAETGFFAIARQLPGLHRPGHPAGQ